MTEMTVLAPEKAQISRRRTAQINLLLGYGRYTVFIFNQLLLVPLYLRLVGIDAYGSWLASGNVVTLLNVLDMGFSLVVTQRLANAFAEGDDTRFAREVGSSLGVVLAAFAFLTSDHIRAVPLDSWVDQRGGKPGCTIALGNCAGRNLVRPLRSSH